MGTFFNGAEFVVNKAQLTEIGMPVISQWTNPLHGLEAAFVVWNLCLGLAVFFLSRVLALMYFVNNINDEAIRARSRKHLLVEAVLFLVFFLLFLGHLLVGDGFAVNPETEEVFMEPNKYLHNLLQMPVVAAVFLIGVVLVLLGIYQTAFTKSVKGIWPAGAGTVLTVLALLLCAGWNHTAYYPSVVDLQSSLTISNSSSSPFTLKTMSIVSLIIPFVLAYIFYAWRALDIRKIDKQEMESGDHTY